MCIRIPLEAIQRILTSSEMGDFSSAITNNQRSERGRQPIFQTCRGGEEQTLSGFGQCIPEWGEGNFNRTNEKSSFQVQINFKDLICVFYFELAWVENKMESINCASYLVQWFISSPGMASSSGQKCY